MYKRFVEEMIIRAYENEFNTYTLGRKDIRIYRDPRFETFLDFEVDTIFENCTLIGSVYTDGRVEFQATNSYNTLKAFYGRA